MVAVALKPSPESVTCCTLSPPGSTTFEVRTQTQRQTHVCYSGVTLEIGHHLPKLFWPESAKGTPTRDRFILIRDGQSENSFTTAKLRHRTS
jgi:hypothetical protein